MNKILCPVDFSDASINALEFAVEVGKKFRSTIMLVHIFTEEEFNAIVGEPSVNRSFKELLSMATHKLERLKNRINEDYKPEGIADCESYLGFGDLTPQLAMMVEEQKFDLIVMGTTGISRVGDVFFGSNTEDVIEKVKIPILCIPEEATFNGFKKIVYASDFKKKDRRAIQKVISFATAFDAQISVLHINTGDDDSEYKLFIEELKSSIDFEKINFVNKDYKDEVGLGIEEFIREENGDLLVVFKKQRNFFNSIFHRSLTKTLSFSTDKPLFVIKLDNTID